VLVLKTDKKSKLDVRWTGPYTVLKKVGEVNYHVKTGKKGNKVKLYHANLMKPYFERVETINVVLEGEEFFEPVHEWFGDVEKGVLTGKQVVEQASLGDLTERQIQELIEVIDRVPGVFSIHPGSTSLVQFDIELTENKCIHRNLHRYSKEQKHLIETELKRMLHLGVIRPSNSRYHLQ